MEFPGLDVKSLSDSEIYKKLGELNAKVMFIYHTSGNGQIIDQLNAIMETLRFEQLSRIGRKTFDSDAAENPIVVDTDPSSEVKTVTKVKVGVTPTNNPFIPKRTKTPGV